jgi:hypothetical protein
MADQQMRSDLASLLIEATTVREHLDDFVLRAGSRLQNGTHCSVSLRHQGRDRLAASSGPRPASCDQVEYEHGSGPCVAAMDELQIVLVGDVDREDRWQPWREAAQLAGFRSAAAVPAHVSEGAEIALNLYSESVDPWDPDTLLRADGFAQDVARTVGLCLRVADLSRQVDDMRHALTARDLLNRAVGAVMATQGCSADEALEQLRRTAADHNLDVVDVARAAIDDATGSAGADRSPGTGH